MKIFILTFGCKVNQYESQFILEKFLKKGFTKTTEGKNADIVIINSCTVTSESDKKVKKSIHKIRHENKNAVIVLTGCMPQAFPDKIFPDVDIVIGNTAKIEIVEKVCNFLKNKQKTVDITPYDKNYNFDLEKIETFCDRTRAFIKIEDGCNRFCSYCIIPYSRGRVRSKPLDVLKNEIQNLADNGYKEIVLVGINLSSFGQDLGLTLCDAVEVVCGNQKIKRVRLGSLEPDHLDEIMIKRLAKQSKLCNQFHVALQSGCDATLKRMNRHYKSCDYFKIINTLRENFENAAITTDAMVGFPGENEEEFLESLKFVESIKFAKVHVFPYSVRPGTAAAGFPLQNTKEVKTNRVHEMIKTAEKSRQNFLKEQLGTTQEVLFEREIMPGVFEGYTKNYLPVKVISDENLSRQIKTVEIAAVDGGFCVGNVLLS